MHIGLKNIKRIWKSWMGDSYSDKNEQNDGKPHKMKGVESKICKDSWGPGWLTYSSCWDALWSFPSEAMPGCVEPCVLSLHLAGRPAEQQLNSCFQIDEIFLNRRMPRQKFCVSMVHWRGTNKLQGLQERSEQDIANFCVAPPAPNFATVAHKYPLLLKKENPSVTLLLHTGSVTHWSQCNS